MTMGNTYRSGKVHVLAEKCGTCIFRPGNQMHLQDGRVKGMVDACLAEQSTITCHKTLYREDADNAVCRGFFDSYANNIEPLRMAQSLGIIEYDPEPKGQ